MILADKILNLRKNNGWSQEELADKMNVSRQSISKWESAAAIPDINRILELAKLFGVTTDYLLKDDMETLTYADGDENETVNTVSLQEMNAFLAQSAVNGQRVAVGTMICILSPALLILLSTFGEISFAWHNDLGSGIGLVVLLLMVAGAVAIFIINGEKMKRYEYLKHGPFELAYGLSGIIKEKRTAYESTYVRNKTVGVVLCILCALPLIISSFLDAPDTVLNSCVAILLGVVSCAVYLFITSGSIKGSYDQLLQEGDYEPRMQENEKRIERFAAVYWPIVIAIYLGWSFYTYNWGFTWVIWPIAGLLFGAIVSFLQTTK